MKSTHAKFLFYFGLWSASMGAAFWAGLAQRPASEATRAAPAPARGYVPAELAGRVPLDGGPASDAPAATGEPVTVQSLLASKGRPDPNELREWAASLDPREFAGLLGALQDLPAGLQRDAVLDALVATWAAREPAGFLAVRNTITNPRVRENGMSEALRTLATQDPKAAVAFMEENTDTVPNQQQARRLRALLDGIAQTDPEGALGYAMSLGNGTTGDRMIQRQALLAVADSMAEQGRFEDALKLFGNLPEDARATSAARLLGRWAEASPQEAGKFVATVDDPALRSRLGGEVASSWARNDPAGAAQWAAQIDQASMQAGTERPGEFLASAVRSWSSYDLNGPAQMLAQLPPSPATDRAVTTFALRARSVDAAGAMNWVNNITDAQARERVAGAVALRWLVDDRAGFTDYLQNNAAQLSPQQREWFAQLPEELPGRVQWQARRLGENWANNTERRAPWTPRPQQ